MLAFGCSTICRHEAQDLSWLTKSVNPDCDEIEDLASRMACRTRVQERALDRIVRRFPGPVTQLDAQGRPTVEGPTLESSMPGLTQEEFEFLDRGHRDIEQMRRMKP